MNPPSIAEGLTAAQRRLLLAASARRGKSWSTMKRHAKLSRIVPLLTSKAFADCFEEARGGGSWQLHHVLSDLGQQVRAHLEESK